MAKLADRMEEISNSATQGYQKTEDAAAEGFGKEEKEMKDQEFIAQKIRSQYTQKQHTELDELMVLDAKVKKPANIFAYIYGSLGAIVMGAGMSLVMTDIGAIIGFSTALVPGIAIGAAGLGMTLTTYPIHKRILNRRKKKFFSQIMELSDRVMKG